MKSILALSALLLLTLPAGAQVPNVLKHPPLATRLPSTGPSATQLIPLGHRSFAIKDFAD